MALDPDDFKLLSDMLEALTRIADVLEKLNYNGAVRVVQVETGDVDDDKWGWVEK
jgi:hypothetical protein